MFTERENRIYDELLELKKGSLEERMVAFKAMGILGNESVQISLDERLDLVEEILNAYKAKRQGGANPADAKSV